MKQTIDLGEGRTYKYSKSYEGITYTRPDGNSLTVSFRRFTDGDAHSCGDFFGISVILHKKPKFGIIKQKEELLFDYNIHFSKNDSQDVKLAKLSISELLKKGYANNNVLMCGDAPGDLDASKKNNVFYYPILVKKEKESWSEFIETGLNNLLENKYEGTYQEEKTNAFLRNLSVK